MPRSHGGGGGGVNPRSSAKQSKHLSQWKCSNHSHFVTNKYFLPFLGILCDSPPGQTCSGESPLKPTLGGGAFWRQERIFF